eukprot:gene3042-2024_t
MEISDPHSTTKHPSATRSIDKIVANLTKKHSLNHPPHSNQIKQQNYKTNKGPYLNLKTHNQTNPTIHSSTIKHKIQYTANPLRFIQQNNSPRIRTHHDPTVIRSQPHTKQAHEVSIIKPTNRSLHPSDPSITSSHHHHLHKFKFNPKVDSTWHIRKQAFETQPQNTSSANNLQRKLQAHTL